MVDVVGAGIVAGDLDAEVGIGGVGDRTIAAMDGDVLDQRIAQEVEQADVAGTAYRVAARHDAVVGEGRIDDVDRTQQRRAAAHADAVGGVVMEVGIGDHEVIEIGGRRDPHAHRVADEAEALDRDGCRQIAGGRVDVADQLEADAWDRRPVGDDRLTGALTDDGQLLADIGAGKGAGPDNDGVAADGGVDRLLDGGVAAVADEQEVVAGAVVDLLDAGEQIGALGTARVHLPARLVAGGRRVGIDGGRDGRRQQRAGIGRGIGARAALDDVGAAAAGEGVVAVVADQHIGPGVAGDGVVAAAAVGILDRRERRRSAHARGCARGQIDGDAGAVVRVADRIAAGAAVNRRCAAVVLEMEVRRGVGGIDDLAVWPGQIDADRLCDGCAVRVVVDDGPNVEGRGPCNAADI